MYTTGSHQYHHAQMDFIYYKARDTLFKLSQQFGVSVGAMKRANPEIDPNNLQIGQAICIQVVPVPPCPMDLLYYNGRRYIVLKW